MELDFRWVPLPTFVDRVTSGFLFCVWFNMERGSFDVPLWFVVCFVVRGSLDVPLLLMFCVAS